MKLSIHSLDAIIFDFDGVLTDNYVYLNSNGSESVRLSRSDGLAFNILRKLNLKTFIISSEKNNVVMKRAKKLRVQAFIGIDNKLKKLKSIINENKFDRKKILYVGNDLNDYHAMIYCGYRICPKDSHKKIIKISHYVLKSKGGNSIVREILEENFKIDPLKYYNL